MVSVMIIKEYLNSAPFLTLCEEGKYLANKIVLLLAQVELVPA